MTRPTRTPSRPLNHKCFGVRRRSGLPGSLELQEASRIVRGRLDSGRNDGRQATPVDARIKELYRRLVRRLHPDLRADGSAAVSALWHEVQEAYAASDVARMEILLALSDIEANRTAEQSLSQMHAVLAELDRSSRALEKSLVEAEGEEAWDFARDRSKRGPAGAGGAAVEIGPRRADTAARSLNETIAEWARGPVGKSRGASGSLGPALRIDLRAGAQAGLTSHPRGASWCNGSTRDSGSLCQGSSPCEAASA